MNSVTLTGGAAAIFLNNTRTGTKTTLATSANPSLYGQSLTFTATVTPNSSGTPTGTVTFDDGSVPIGSGTLVNGSASFTTSALGAGTHSISAVYSGDLTFSSSASDATSSSMRS